jgi:3-oxoacyl-[acyl-carrier-protein] synthase III
MSRHLPLTDIGIAGAAYHLPGSPIDVVDWGREQDAAPDLISLLLANDCRYFFDGPNVSDVDSIAAAIDKLSIDAADWQSGVRYLVHAHTQNFSMPAAPSSILTGLAERYALNLKLCFSVSHLACASLINGISLAAQLLQNDQEARYALIVSSDRTFGGSAYRLRPPGCIQSDGSSAILLCKEKMRCRLGHATMRNFAQLHEGPSNPSTIAATSRLTCFHSIQLLRDHSEETGIRLEDYGQILPVNADKHYWLKIAEGLQLNESHFFFDNFPKLGHANCADFAINLVDRGFDLLDQGKLVLAFGQSNVGAHAALTLVPN